MPPAPTAFTALPTPPATTQSSALLALPDEILHAIALLAEEKTIWRMMATTRATRQAAEPTLRRFLTERVVVHHSRDSPAVSHHVPWYNDPTPQRYSAPALRATHASFRSHLEAYPPSASLLRRLVVEVGDESKVGWDLIQMIFDQLESLAILAPVQEEFDPLDVIWSGSWVPHPGTSTRFPNLTRLAIMAEKVFHDYFRFLIPLAPKLRDLTIGCVESCGLPPKAPIMLDLERLAVWASQTRAMVNVCISLRTQAPKLRYLSLSLSLDILPPKLWRSDWISVSTSICSDLEGVALYGSAAYDFGPAQSRAQSERNKVTRFARLETLVLEEQTRWTTDAYPLLLDAKRPLLPSITRIIWVDRRFGLERWPIDDKRPMPPCEKPALRMLFEEYSTLQQVQWVNAYPVDPFADDFGRAFLDEHLIRRVGREEAMEVV